MASFHRLALLSTIFFAAVAGLLAAAQSPGQSVLGVPCTVEKEGIAELQAWHALVTRHGEEVRRGNREAAVRLAKQIVRGRCSNEHWWLKLAESLFELKRPEESVQALEALYARKSNAVDERLHQQKSPLHNLLSSNVYRRSNLAAKLASDRVALEKRRSDAKAGMAAGLHPPSIYVAHGACPFECCGFGPWSAIQDTELVDGPEGRRVVGRVRKGEHVQGLTGEVHLRPLPVRVRFNSPEGFRAGPGSVVYLLDYVGEGHGHVWADGKIVESDIASVGSNCTFPGPACWGEFINPEDTGRQRDGIWWVKVKTSNGVTGWTNKPGHFGGIDRCG